ncbi:hypothetical protein BGW39_001970, partial [Mortierella sp. 14UC]
QLTSNLHTTNLLNRPGHPDAKLLITCRSQYLGPDYRFRFVPKAADSLFQEAVIAPFSKDQIENYIEVYVPLEPRTWVKKDYMDKLETIPNLMDLVKNPFLLTLCLEALPRVVRGAIDLSRLRVTRHWMKMSKSRLQDRKLDKDAQMAFEELLEAGFEQSGIKFQKNLATAIFIHQKGKPVVDYIGMRDKTTWKSAYFDSRPEASLLRGASLLNRVGTQYRFVHRSILEYFYSCIFYRTPDTDDDFARQVSFNPRDLLSPIDNHPLFQKNLVIEPSIIQFLAKRVQLDPSFKRLLLAIIELSKTDEQAARAAANAITILVRAGVQFNGQDLRGVRIPGADVTGGQFDSAHFQEADLTGVIFTRSRIRQADLGGARMEGVQFGELPYLKGPGELRMWYCDAELKCAYSPDGAAFAIGFDDGAIRIFDTKTWKRTHSYRAHAEGVSDLTYSPCSNRLLSTGYDCTPRLWNSGTKLSEYVVKDLSDVISTVVFSPSGNQFALACAKGMVMLYSTQSGTNDYVWRDLEDESLCISFSPDGQHIIRGGSTGTIRRLDIHSGRTEQVAERTIAKLRCMATSPDGQWLASADGDRLQLLETATGKQGPSWHTFDHIWAIIYSPDGQSIATACENKRVALWNAQTGLPLSIFTGHTSYLGNMAFLPNGLQLASCGRDGTARLWEVTSSGTGFDSQLSSQGVAKVTYSPDGRFVLSGYRDKTLRRFDADSGESNLVLQGSLHDPLNFAFSPDGLQVATRDIDHAIRIWDLGTEKCVVEFSEMEHVETMTFSPHSSCIAARGWRDIIELLDTRSGTIHRRLENHDREDSGFDAEAREDLMQMICAQVEQEGKLDMSNARSREIFNTLVSHSTDDDIVCLSFPSDGNRIVSGGEDGAVRIWDVETGEWTMLSWNDHETVTRVEFSPNDTHVAFTLEDHKLQLWREQDIVPQHILKHKDTIESFAFSSCGDRITTAGGNVVQLWRRHTSGEIVESWTCVATIGDFFEVIDGISWRPGTLEFATGCDDGSMRAWQVVEDESGQVSVKQVWGVGLASLAVSDAVIDNVVGLSTVNRKLLLQRGAKDGSASSDDGLSEIEEEIDAE